MDTHIYRYICNSNEKPSLESYVPTVKSSLEANNLSLQYEHTTNGHHTYIYNTYRHLLWALFIFVFECVTHFRVSLIYFWRNELFSLFFFHDAKFDWLKKTIADDVFELTVFIDFMFHYLLFFWFFKLEKVGELLKCRSGSNEWSFFIIYKYSFIIMGYEFGHFFKKCTQILQY